MEKFKYLYIFPFYMTQVTIHLNQDDWIEFIIKCKKEGTTGSERIREFIKKELGGNKNGK